MGGYQGRILRAGDRVEIGLPEKRSGVVFGGSHENDTRSLFRTAAEPLALPEGGASLRVLRGAHFGSLADQRFRVSTRSDRMGYRLEGTAMAEVAAAELISSAMPAGALQVPPTRQPILLMADHATTGGYAVAATVITADSPLAGQLAPGDWIEFEPCSLAAADDALRARELALAGTAA